jgi:integrase
VGTLFYFAEARGYVTKGSVDTESIAVARDKGANIEIFRPGELERILAAAEKKPEFIPFLAIGAFAGLRAAEIQRLDWAEIRLDDGFIEVKASKAKTASRRLVPITDNLKAWLAPHKKACGPVCHYVTLSHQLDWLAETVNDAWSKEKEPGEFV